MSEFICTECHYTGKRKGKKPGSKGMEIFMWSLFPLGIPYSMWRMIKKTYVCGNCDSSFLVTTDSTLGRQLVKNIEASLAGKPRVTQKEYLQFIEQAKRQDSEPSLVINSLQPAAPAQSRVVETQNIEEEIPPISSVEISIKPRGRIDPNEW